MPACLVILVVWFGGGGGKEFLMEELTLYLELQHVSPHSSVLTLLINCIASLLLPFM